MAKLLPKAEKLVQPGSSPASPVTLDRSKTWDLGVYPGGTTAELQGINDFGVAMGWGDVPVENGTETRMIGVPLLGCKAGQWFESGVSIGEDWTGDGGGISNTGLIVGNIMSSNGWPEAYAWMPNHAGFRLGKYRDDDGSAAIAISHSGTFIVGNSGKLLDDGTMRVTPLVWTSKFIWDNGRPTLSWEMHALPTGGLEKPGAVFEGITLNFWGGWGVNDLGQIAGDGWAYDPALDEYWEIAVAWTPTRGGWKMQRLPHQSAIAVYPYTEALAMNNRGEIVGDYWVCNDEECAALPALWKINAAGTHIGPLTVLATLSGLQQGWNVAWGINDAGDIVGVSNDADWNWLATRWKTKDASTATVLGFPGDWSVGFAVNNFGIAVGTYGLGDNPEQAVAIAIR